MVVCLQIYYLSADWGYQGSITKIGWVLASVIMAALIYYAVKMGLAARQKGQLRVTSLMTAD